MKTSIHPVLITLALACFALAPQARAVCQEDCLTNNNTVLGEDALINNTTGFQNTATGWETLVNNTTGSGNTATGSTALLNNTTGNVNMAAGSGALQNNTTGNENTAIGSAALLNNRTGNRNTATGSGALGNNTTGFENTATGSVALPANTTGNRNTATGRLALLFNTTGGGNTANGTYALSKNTSGNNNIALGASAGAALTTGDDNIDIGNAGFADESNTVRIGTEGTHTATYIAGIRQAPLAHGTAVAVGITADGQLGVRPSSVRFKELVKPMDKASEAILALKPVTFRYKKDPAALPQFGLVAEEVAKVNPDLVTPDVEGKPFTVRYDEINAMLLNEFLKEHRKVEALQASFAQQQSDFRATVAQQQKQLDALAAGLQKVSAQLEATKPAPQTLADNH